MSVHGDVYLKLDLVRIFAEKVVEEMKLSAGGDEYVFKGATGDIDMLKDCIADFQTYLDRLKRLRKAKCENAKINLSLSVGSHKLGLVANVRFVHDEQNDTAANHGVTSLAIVERHKEIRQVRCPEWLEDWIIENLTDGELIAEIGKDA